MEAVFGYLVLGMAAGIAAGLFGIGGGLIIVPVLVWTLPAQGVADTALMHLALGSSLATIVFTSLSSVRAHQRRGAIDWPVFWGLAPGIVVGAWGGAAIANSLPTVILQRIFGVFELVVAAQMLLAARPAPHRQLPAASGMIAAGLAIGAVSAIVGIGGGTMTVPFLVWCNVAMRRAIATSAACGLPIAVAGSIGYIVAGWDASGLPQWATGYIYWPAVVAIVVTSVLFAPLGAWLAHTLPTAALKRLFGVLLAVLGLRMLLLV